MNPEQPEVQPACSEASKVAQGTEKVDSNQVKPVEKVEERKEENNLVKEGEKESDKAENAKTPCKDKSTKKEKKSTNKKETKDGDDKKPKSGKKKTRKEFVLPAKKDRTVKDSEYLEAANFLNKKTQRKNSKKPKDKPAVPKPADEPKPAEEQKPNQEA